jgi:hypothetical protein
MQDLASNDRAEALQAAKLAVRAYARTRATVVQERSWRGGGPQAGPTAWQRGAKTVLQATQPPAAGTPENPGFSTYSCEDVVF